jgi:hypothetical protein
LQRRLRILAVEFEKGARSFDPGGALKSGATLVRQWRGRTHTVLVREDGFEYDGQRYRSLTVIAERITGGRREAGDRCSRITSRSFSASAADMWNSRRTDPAVFSLVRGERGKPDICFDRTSFQIG